MQSRRTVLKTVAGASLMSAASLGRVLGANDRVRVGFIGHGLIGTRHLLDFKAQPDVEIVAVSELSEERLEAARPRRPARAPPRYKDFRKILDRPDVDAVVVVHARPLARADDDPGLRRGQGRLRREAADARACARASGCSRRRGAHKRVVQVGTQQRSGKHYKRCAELIRGRAHRRRPQRADGVRPQRPARLHASPVGDRCRPPTGTCGWGRRPSWRTTRPLPLPLPLVLGLLGRPDDEPAGPPPRHRPVGDGPGAAAAGRRDWAGATRSRASARRPTCSRRSSSTRASSPPGRATRSPRRGIDGLAFYGTKGTLS